jgi:hypothetical protein
MRRGQVVCGGFLAGGLGVQIVEGGVDLVDGGHRAVGGLGPRVLLGELSHGAAGIKRAGQDGDVAVRDGHIAGRLGQGHGRPVAGLE